MRRLRCINQAYFNPRTHEECDSARYSSIMISRNFNPRTHEECDHTQSRSRFEYYHFNPRTHEECDGSDRG